MALIDVVIEILKINCSAVQCYGYPSEIEAMFYLLFFPTVFIILFVWIVVGALLDRMGGLEGGFRILISVSLYSFIVFQGYYTLFVSLSQLWWILVATLLGLFIFISKIVRGGGHIGGGSGRSTLPSIGRGGFFGDVRSRLAVSTNPSDYEAIQNHIRIVESSIDKLQSAANILKNADKKEKGKLMESYHYVDSETSANIEAFKAFLRENPGFKKTHGKKVMEFEDRVHAIRKSIRK